MTYHFPPDLATEIQLHMATGQYSSEDDVLRDALQALRASKCHDEEVAAIQQGIDDMEAGRVKPLREFDREFRQKKNIAQDA